MPALFLPNFSLPVDTNFPSEGYRRSTQSRTMSSLNSLFNRASFGVRCKTCLNLAISRIKLLRNKREAQLKHMRAEIVQYLRTGQEAVARIRVEHIIREENILAAYEVLELFCEFVLARVPILEAQKDCPIELQEAIASIIFASPRCSDLPEFMQIQVLFTAKYGKEFVSAASELRPDSSVNRTVIEKLSVRTPLAAVKIRVLKAIARDYNLEWDSSNTEAEFNKKHEDLLGGSNPIGSQMPVVENVAYVSSSMNRLSVTPLKENPKPHPPQPRAAANNNTRMAIKESEPVRNQREETPGDERPRTNQSSSDILERARVAIAYAERASAAARAAAQLMNVRLVHQPNNNNPCE